MVCRYLMGVASLHRLARKCVEGRSYMIAPDMETAIDRLQELVDAARKIAPFTGAGISTECGIADFRSPVGLCTTNRPIPFVGFVAVRDLPYAALLLRFAM